MVPYLGVLGPTLAGRNARAGRIGQFYVLQGQPGLNAIMTANDEGALGGLGAFTAASRQLPCVTDFGGNDEVLKDVQAGKIYASVALQFQADMTASFDTLVKMQADPKANGEVLVVPQKVVTGNG